MDYLKNIVITYLNTSNENGIENNFKKPSAYKNINTSTAIKLNNYT